MTPELEVLRCSSCSAPVALADTATVKCTSCGADVAVPQSHRDAFSKMRRDSEASAEANRLYAKLGAPPRALRVIGVVFDPSGVTRPLTGSRNALLRLFGWYYKWVFVAFAPFILLGAAMVAIILTVRAIGAHYHANVIETLPKSTMDLIGLPVPIAAVLVGTVLGVYGRRKALSRHELQAALAAKPPAHEGGPSSCRACGAPLSVAGDALGVRCVYCGADNLVALPQAWLAHLGERTRRVGSEITKANAQLAQEHAKIKRALWWRLGAIVVVLGTIIGISIATGTDEPDLQNVPPTWGSYATDPRPLVQRDVVVRKYDTILSDKVQAIAMTRCPVTVAIPRPDCAAGSCTLRLYAALRHGETVDLTVDPPAHVRVEDHTGFPWPKTPDGTFGDIVAEATAAKLTLDVKWSSWHELAFIVPDTTRSLSLCFAVHHP